MRISLVFVMLLVDCLLRVLPALAQDTHLPVRLKGKWGCIDATGKLIVPAEFEFIHTFKDEKAMAQRNGLLGVIDAKGNILIPFQYLNLDTLTAEHFAICTEENTWGVIKTNKEVIIQPIYQKIKTIKNKNKDNIVNYFFLAKANKFWEAFDKTGKSISPAQYDAYSYYTDSLLTRERNKLKGLINLEGREILPAEYEAFEPYPQNLKYSYLRKKGLVGLINMAGEVIIPCIYDYIKTSTQGEITLFEVGKTGKKGFISTDFKVVVPAEYDAIECALPNTGFYNVENNGKKGVFDSKTQALLFNTVYEKITIVSKELALVSLKKDGLILTGVNNFVKQIEVIPIQYNALMHLSGGGRNYFLANQLLKYTIYDSSGKVLGKDLEVDYISFDPSGIFLWRKGAKWGAINDFGMLQPKYDGITNFKRNLAMIRIENAWGLVNIRTQIVLPILYKTIKMKGHTARVFKDDGSTEILTFDAQGNIIDRVTYNTKIKTISVKKDKSDNAKEDEWTFDMGSQRPLNIVNNSVINNLRQGGIPNRSKQTFTIDNLTFSYHPTQNKWFALRQNKDTLLKPILDYVQELPTMHLVRVMQVKPDTEGADKGKLFSHAGLLDSQTGKWIYPLTKMAWRLTERLLQDFRFGDAGRLINGFLYRNGGVINVVKTTIQNKTIQKRISYAEPFQDTLINSAQFNVGGYIRRKDKITEVRKEDIQGGAWGLMNREGVVIAEPIYEKIYNNLNINFVGNKNGWGALDSVGKKIIACEFSQLAYLKNSNGTPMPNYISLAKYAERFGFLDSTRTIVIDANYKNARAFREGFAPVKQDSLVGKERKSFWTFINTQGLKIHPYTFNEVRHFYQGLAAVKVGQKWGYLNIQGQIAIAPNYSQAQDFHDGKAVVRELKTGKMLYITPDGVPINDLRFEKAQDFLEGRAIVQDKETHLYGLLNEQGNILLPTRYVDISPFNGQGYAFYKHELGAKIGLLDRQGHEITKAKYNEIEPFENGLARIRNGKELNFIDTTGNLLIKYNCTALSHFDGNFCLAKTEDGWGYLDKKGKWQIIPSFEHASHFEQGIAQVTPKGTSKSIFIDTLGKEVNKPEKWHTLGDFEEYAPDSLLRYARIKQRGRWGYWDKELDKVFIYPTYRKASAFYNGYAKIENLRKQVYYINTKKNAFNGLPDQVKWMDSEHDNFKTIRQNGLYGFTTMHDFTYSEPKFGYLGEFSENRIPVSVPMLYGVSDRQGRVLLQPIYERIIYMGADIFRVELNDQIGYWHKNKGWLWEASK